MNYTDESDLIRWQNCIKLAKVRAENPNSSFLEGVNSATPWLLAFLKGFSNVHIFGMLTTVEEFIVRY